MTTDLELFNYKIFPLYSQSTDVRVAWWTTVYLNSKEGLSGHHRDAYLHFTLGTKPVSWRCWSCHTICGLTQRPIWRLMLQIPNCPHSRALAVFARCVPWILLQLLPQGSRNVDHGMQEKQKIFFWVYHENFRVTPPIECALHLEQQTLFSLKKMSCFSVTVHREGKTFFLLLSWELWVANK